MIIAIHEIEAWFLAEVNHFKRIDKRLTASFIKSKLGFNPYTTNPESREHPAKDINDIYQLVGKSYTKRYGQTLKIVNKLDYNNIFRNLRYEIEPLGKAISALDSLRKRRK